MITAKCRMDQFGIFGLDSSSSSESSEEEFDNMPRRVIERINFDYALMTDNYFKEKFRVHKCTFEYILQRVGNGLRGVAARQMDLTPTQQILIALHWMGCGSQYHVTADCHGVSKVSVYRCVKSFSRAVINTLFREIVRWPTDVVGLNNIKTKFSQISNMPPIVAGVIDGSLIDMDAPHINENAYVDRHSNHSINALFVCGPNHEFYYANVNFPGSVNDARILRLSNLLREWDGGWRPFPGAVILGDSAFPLKNWLMTPNIPHEIPENETTRRYLRSFKSTRRLVENAFGIIKERFPCLNYFRLAPAKVGELILVAAVIHNLEIIINRPDYIDSDDDDLHYFNDIAINVPVNDTAIAKLRTLLEYFEVG